MLKLRSVLLILMMSFLCLFQVNGKALEVHAIPGPDYASATLTSYGSGTSADPYRIYFLKQLGELTLINMVNDHINRYGHYLLMNDLDFSDANADGIKNDPYMAPFTSPGSNWAPIGTYYGGTRSFVGVLDGNSFSIRNLLINRNSEFQGLFGVVNGTGEIKNLHLINASIRGTVAVGGIAGALMNGAHLTNVSVQGTVSGTGMIGGLVGLVEDGAGILNSGSTATLDALQNCGGLVGYASLEFGRLSISNSYFTGSFNALASIDNVGGMIGQTLGAGNPLEVDIQNVLVIMNKPMGLNRGNFVGDSGSSLLIDMAYSDNLSMMPIGSFTVPPHPESL